jgi:hypothetical protein
MTGGIPFSTPHSNLQVDPAVLGPCRISGVGSPPKEPFEEVVGGSSDAGVLLEGRIEDVGLYNFQGIERRNEETFSDEVRARENPPSNQRVVDCR